jgi:hypothetical protein
MTADGESEDLKAAQGKRAAEEEDLARTAVDEDEVAQHERRADKARYLREKLEERTVSEREAGERDVEQ